MTVRTSPRGLEIIGFHLAMHRPVLSVRLRVRFSRTFAINRKIVERVGTYLVYSAVGIFGDCILSFCMCPSLLLAHCCGAAFPTLRR